MIERIDNLPVRIWLVEIEPGTSPSEEEIIRSVSRDELSLLFGSACRGVPFATFERVLRTGIDVTPTNAPIYVAEFGKALEYGDLPKVVMLLDWKHLHATYREVPKETDPAEIEQIRGEYPNAVESVDGSHTWFSRLPTTDPRMCSSYESDYCRWIPGNAKDALRGIVVVAVLGDGTRNAMQEVLRQSPTA